MTKYITHDQMTYEYVYLQKHHYMYEIRGLPTDVLHMKFFYM